MQAAAMKSSARHGIVVKGHGGVLRYPRRILPPPKIFPPAGVSVGEALKHAFPDPQLNQGPFREIYLHRLSIWDRVRREARKLLMAERYRIPYFAGAHYIRKTLKNGLVLDLGLVSMKLVSQSYTQRLVDSMQDSTTTPIDVYQYHTYGSSSTAENNSQNALVAEFAGSVWTAATREGSTQGEGASANIYQAAQDTNLVVDTGQGPITVQEVGVFLSSTFAAVGMIDRGLTGSIGLDDAEEIGNTFEYTAMPE